MAKKKCLEKPAAADKGGQMKRLGRHGITLVEVIITLSIFTVMIGSIYSTLFISQRSWTNYSNNVAPRQEIRWALTSMARELRGSREIFIVKDDKSITLRFKHSKYGAVQYKWNAEGENGGQIIRKVANGENVLARHITHLDFVSPVNNQVYVAVTAGEENKVTVGEYIALRTATGFYAQSENDKIK